MRKLLTGIVVGFGLTMLLTGPVSAETGHRRSQIDGPCTQLANDNKALGPDVAHLMNYVGCDPVYQGHTLIGYAQGQALCDQFAYFYTFGLHLSGAEYHGRMGDDEIHTGCVMAEDWGWAEE